MQIQTHTHAQTQAASRGNRSSSLIKTRNENTCTRRGRNNLSMLRNFDLPEALVFYGYDTVIHRHRHAHSGTETETKTKTDAVVRPGVLRLLEEAKEMDIPTFILSEHYTMDELSNAVESVEPLFRSFSEKNVVHYRSSLEEFIVKDDSNNAKDCDDDDDDDDDDESYIPNRFIGKGIGHAPCPAALYDAVNTITIEPRGFGGSSGFGVKNWEAGRAPLPQHCVVFVSSTSDANVNVNVDVNVNVNLPSGSKVQLDRSDGSGSVSRDRTLASHYAGMRVIYIEDEGLPCTAEHIADGIVESLGTEDDWEMVTLDDISSPGSFWLNMMQAKDEDGYTVNTETIIEGFIERREKVALLSSESETSFNSDLGATDGYGGVDGDDNKPDEEELARMLADLDSL